MGRWPWIVVLLSVGLLATVTLAGAAATAPGVSDSSDASDLQAEPVAAQQDRGFESLQLRLDIQPDGDVIWTYRYIYPVESDDERAAFEDYAERFESEETALYRDFRNQSVALTDAASERLGREMAATDYERTAGVDATPTREIGEVELTYRWTNFGRVDDGEVHVGDVFEGGFYLADGQSLVFQASDPLDFESVAPEDTASTAPLEDRRTVTWSGERRFPDGHPRATLSIEGGATGADTATDGDDGSMDMSGPMLLGGGIVLLVLALLAVAAVRDDLPALRRADTAESNPVSTPDGPPEPAPDVGDEPAGEDAESAESSESDSEPEAVSDEQRVQSLLEEHDGRLKQSAIVEETEWSKSKVSMLLSEMEDEELISKIQVGRENIIALQGDEPEAASSPFDDSE